MDAGSGPPSITECRLAVPCAARRGPLELELEPDPSPEVLIVADMAFDKSVDATAWWSREPTEMRVRVPVYRAAG